MPEHTPSISDIKAMSEVMTASIKSARPLIMRHAGKVTALAPKLDGSPVTDIDIAVENQTRTEFAKHYPDVPVYGEEGGYDDDISGMFWLIDPIDGTESFINNIPTFTTMAVLINHHEVIAAIIYNPTSDDLYTAQKGCGTFKNGTRVTLATQPLPSTVLCKQRFFDTLNPLLAPHNITCEKSPAGGGFGFTMVLDGATAARYTLHGGGYIHDYAPGAFLIQEAGGAIIPVQNDTYDYTSRSFVACHPALETIVQSQRTALRALEKLPR